MQAPVEVSVRLFGWEPGESEVEISIAETSDLAGLLGEASPEETLAVLNRLRARVVAELVDAFHSLSLEPVGSG